MFPKQAEFLAYEGREALYGGAAGGGKALATTTPIPTPFGMRTMGDLKVGDFVFGDDGNPTAILACTSEMLGRPCFKITFDDGNTVVCDAGHLWRTFTAKELAALTRRDDEWRAKRRAKRLPRHSGNKSEKFRESLRARNADNPPPTKDAPNGAIRTAEEIFESLLDHRGRRNHAVECSPAVVMEDRSDLPLDPYLLGLWLGDGSTHGATYASADSELVQAFRDRGFVVTPYSNKYAFGVRGFNQVLRDVGVFGNKHVPEKYLMAGRQQRLDLLCGLMDTDGTVARTSGSAEFTSTLKTLADAVAELACSLGHKAAIREGVAKLNGRVVGPKWTVKWLPPEPVFKLKRKRDLQKIATRRTCKYRYIVSCERVESVPVKCIQVAAENGMFLATRAYIPTHNSVALLAAALQYVDVPGYAAVLMRRTYKQLSKADSILGKAKDWLMPFVVKGQLRWNGDEHKFTFPSGATLEFGHMEREESKFNYQGGIWHFIGVDETTQFTQGQLSYPLTRQRREVESPLPIRWRGASNPGGVGHDYVKQRFIKDKKGHPVAHKNRRFFPATIYDNPNIDREEYIEQLKDSGIDPITLEQLLKGNWDAVAGGLFRRDWFRGFHRDPTDWNYVLTPDQERFRIEQRPRFQTCDPAASASKDSDEFVVSTWCISPKGNLLWIGCHAGHYEIEDQVRTVKNLYRQYRPDFIAVEEVLNQRALAQILRRATDPPMVVKSVSPLGKKKRERATPAVHFAASGRVMVPEDDPNFPVEDTLGQLVRFTGADDSNELDDRFDTFAYAVDCMRTYGGATAERPRGVGGIVTALGQFASRVGWSVYGVNGVGHRPGQENLDKKIRVPR